jgi:hypothetical protein
MYFMAAYRSELKVIRRATQQDMSRVGRHVVQMVVKGQVEEVGHQHTTVVVNNVAINTLGTGLTIKDGAQSRSRLGVPVVDAVHRAHSTHLQ